MIYVAMGLRAAGHDILVTPPWTWAEDYMLHAEGLPVGQHVIDLSVAHGGITVKRVDQLSQPLFVQHGAASTPRSLGVGEHVRLSPAPVYLTTSSTGQTLWTVEAELHAFGPPPSTARWSHSLVVFLVLLVAGFHVALARVVYVDYCRKGA